jgi:hypothetical protein
MFSPHRKSLLLVAAGILVGLVASHWQSLLAIGGGAMTGPKPATEFTKKANVGFGKKLDFDDRQDFEDANRGFLAPLLNDSVVKNDKGVVIADVRKLKIPSDAPTPDTVNPSLWRQAQLNGISGLFKVVDRIYQVRRRHFQHHVHRGRNRPHRDGSAHLRGGREGGPGAVLHASAEEAGRRGHLHA